MKWVHPSLLGIDTPTHLPAISSILISSRAWAHSSGVEVFLNTLTTPNLFHKVDSVYFLHRRSSVLQLEVCMAPHCMLTAHSILPAAHWHWDHSCSSLDQIVQIQFAAHCLGGLKCKVECQPLRDTRMCQAIHFLIPCWLLPVELDISRAEGRNLKNDNLRLAANTAQMKIT
jgi:hypothetical protein